MKKRLIFLSAFLTFLLVAVFSPSKSLAIYQFDGDLLDCPVTCTTADPGTCAMSAPGDCPSCGSTSNDCCSGADPWTKYDASCKLIGPFCDWAWVFDTVVCSTADTCVSGEYGLRPGYCDCSSGSSIYKTCCNGTSLDICTGGDHTGECNGTAVMCGYGSYPACGQAACDTLSGPTSTPAPGEPTPVPTAEPGVSAMYLWASPTTVTVGETVTFDVCQKPNCCFQSFYYYNPIKIETREAHGSYPALSVLCNAGDFSDYNCNSCAKLGNASNTGSDGSCIWNTSGYPPGTYNVIAYYGGHSGNGYCDDGAAAAYATITLLAPAPTNTPVPTSTPTATKTPTPTPTSTNTPTPTPTCPIPAIPSGLACDIPGNMIRWNPVSGADHYPFRVDDQSLPACWRGDCSVAQCTGDVCEDVYGTSRAYDFQTGKTYQVWVHTVNYCGNWSSGSTLIMCSGPTPTPTPTNTPTPTSTPTPTPTPVLACPSVAITCAVRTDLNYNFRIDWTDAGTEAGYKIYRNDIYLATVGPNVLTLVDDNDGIGFFPASTNTYDVRPFYIGQPEVNCQQNSAKTCGTVKKCAAASAPNLSVVGNRSFDSAYDFVWTSSNMDNEYSSWWDGYTAQILSCAGVNGSKTETKPASSGNSDIWVHVTMLGKNYTSSCPACFSDDGTKCCISLPTAETRCAVCAQPTNINYSSITCPGGIQGNRVTWTDNSSLESGFTIYPCSGGCSYFARVGPNVTSYDDCSGLGVSSYTARCFYESAACKNIPPPITPTPAPTSTPTLTPTPPPIGCPTSVSSTQVARVPADGRYNKRLTWIDTSGEDYYEIYRCSGLGCNPTVKVTQTAGPDIITWTDDNSGAGFVPPLTLVYEVRPVRLGDPALSCPHHTNILAAATATPTPGGCLPQAYCSEISYDQDGSLNTGESGQYFDILPQRSEQLRCTEDSGGGTKWNWSASLPSVLVAQHPNNQTFSQQSNLGADFDYSNGYRVEPFNFSSNSYRLDYIIGRFSGTGLLETQVRDESTLTELIHTERVCNPVAGLEKNAVDYWVSNPATFQDITFDIGKRDLIEPVISSGKDYNLAMRALLGTGTAYWWSTGFPNRYNYFQVYGKPNIEGTFTPANRNNREVTWKAPDPEDVSPGDEFLIESHPLNNACCWAGWGDTITARIADFGILNLEVYQDDFVPGKKYDNCKTIPTSVTVSVRKAGNPIGGFLCQDDGSFSKLALKPDNYSADIAIGSGYELAGWQFLKDGDVKDSGTASPADLLNLAGSKKDHVLRIAIKTKDAGPWWQVKDGDLHAQGSITSLIPPTATYKYLITNGDNPFPAVVSYNGSLNYGSYGSISTKNWQAKTLYNGPTINFTYLKNRLNVDTGKNLPDRTDPRDLPSTSGIYYHEGNLDLNDIPRTFDENKKIIVFVNGDVTVKRNIVVEEGSFFALIASGNLTFDGAVARAQGFFLTDKILTVSEDGDADNRFLGQGSFVAWEGFNLSRDTGSKQNVLSSCLFTSRPDFYVNAPKEFLFKQGFFQEVAP